MNKNLDLKIACVEKNITIVHMRYRTISKELKNPKNYL